MNFYILQYYWLILFYLNFHINYSLDTLEKEVKDSRDRGREDHVVPHKQNYFKPTGVRNNFLTGHQAIAQKIQPPAQSSK